jgi:hypothetical protein
MEEKSTERVELGKQQSCLANRQCPVHLQRQIVGGNLKENFSWAPDEYVRFLAQTEAGSIYRVRAIHVTDMNAPESALTRNGVEFTEEELRAAARSLGYRPLDLNHEPPDLAFPDNRVIDAEFEDARVEALIAIRDLNAMNLIETKKIVAVSIEAQYRWADVLCDNMECWLRPVGIIFTKLALLTPGVLPGDPLASIVMKKIGKAELAAVKSSSSVTGTTVMVDTTPRIGGVLMEKKEATPPLEPAKEATPPLPAAPPSTPTPEPQTEVKVEVDASKALEQLHCAEQVLAAVSEIKDRVGSLESHVKLLEEQRKGTRRTS